MAFTQDDMNAAYGRGFTAGTRKGYQAGRRVTFIEGAIESAKEETTARARPYGFVYLGPPQQVVIDWLVNVFGAAAARIGHAVSLNSDDHRTIYCFEANPEKIGELSQRLAASVHAAHFAPAPLALHARTVEQAITTIPGEGPQALPFID